MSIRDLSIKKILFVNTSTKISGAEISLINCLFNLNTSKYCIHIILPDRGNLYHKLNNKFKVCIFNIHKFKKSLSFLYLLRSLINIIVQSFRISRYVKKNKIEILYANSLYSQVYCIFIKLFSRTKLIWHARDNVSGLIARFIFCVPSDKIICVSNYISQQIKFSSKKHTIYNGLELSEWIVPKDFNGSLKKKLELEKDVKLVIQVGQLVNWKNHNDFIKAAKLIIEKYRKVHFLIVGSDLFGNNLDYYKTLRRSICQEGLSNNMTFVGYMEGMKEILCQVDILIHTATIEPFGRVLIEAMVMEKPVVAYNTGGPAEIIEHEINGFLVESNNYKSVAERVIQLLTDEQLCKKVGNKAKERIKTNFNIQNTTLELESVLDSI